MNWLVRFKRQAGGKDCHKEVAKKLQRLESSIMLESVGKQLVDDGVPFYTVHDAVFTLPEYTAYVSDLIETAMRSELGAVPRLEVVR